MQPPWYTHLTLDLLAHLLSQTLFHPFIAWLIPLCLRAIATPYHAPDFILSCVWATLVSLSVVLSAVNKRVAYGLPRELDWEEEVVVITGGASGLGRVLAEMFGMRRVGVAVLDVKRPEESEESEALEAVKFYLCDVGDAEAVERVRGEIEQDLGKPTILISNAATLLPHSFLNPSRTPNLTPSLLQKDIQTNLLSTFNLLHTFLPSLLSSPQGGTIITISSVLGKFPTAHLSPYTASKAALISLHRSLHAELRSSSAPAGAENIRTILVTPGQLRTRMFEDVETPNAFFAPLVEPVELAREIVKMVDSGMSGEISLPFYARWIEWLTVMPVGVQEVVRWVVGADRAMERAVKGTSADGGGRRKSGKES